MPGMGSGLGSGQSTAMSWRWVLLNAHGSPIDAPEAMSADQRFPSQSEAETWVGEAWPLLLAHGVAAVTLREADRYVYGPMPLTPA